MEIDLTIISIEEIEMPLEQRRALDRMRQVLDQGVKDD